MDFKAEQGRPLSYARDPEIVQNAINRVMHLWERLQQTFPGESEFVNHVIDMFWDFDRAVTEFPQWKSERDREERRRNRDRKKAAA